MTGKSAIADIGGFSEGARGTKNAKQAVLCTDDIVEQGSLVVSLTDKASDGSGFKIGINGVVDLHQVVVSPESLNKRSEAEMRFVSNHSEKLKMILGGM